MTHPRASARTSVVFFFFFNDTATTEIYTLSLHDALPISDENRDGGRALAAARPTPFRGSGPHSPPRWRTRGLRSDLPLPSARRERFRGHVWPVDCTWPGESAPATCCLAGLPVRPSPLRHTDRGVLAQPFNHTKKYGRGQRILPHPPDFFAL